MNKWLWALLILLVLALLLVLGSVAVFPRHTMMDDDGQLNTGQ